MLDRPCSVKYWALYFNVLHWGCKLVGLCGNCGYVANSMILKYDIKIKLLCKENIVSKNTPVLNEEQITAFLKETLEAVKTEEDPDVLNAYRKIFRKNIPFTLRSYVAAYFIKEFEASAFSRSKSYNRRPNARFSERSRSYHSDRPPVDRPTLEPSESVSIFMSVGRSRRVFPRDIITLLIQNADITRERIGDIRILENYSFVQVMSADADGIIEKLNNFPYRGRNLSVSYSRKPEMEDEVQEAVAEAAGGTEA